jgi:hypothetical protein
MSVSEHAHHTTTMHRIFEIQDGLRQIHRLAPILSERVQIEKDISRDILGSDELKKDTISNYEASLFMDMQDDEGAYLPKYTAFQVLGQKLHSFSTQRVIDYAMPPEDDWSQHFYDKVKLAAFRVSTPTTDFIRGNMDPEEFWASTNNMQQQFAELLRFVYDWNTSRQDSTHKKMIQDSAEWSELCECCVWILTQAHCAACIGVYTDFMTKRHELNQELQRLVLEIGFFKHGLQSTVDTPPTAAGREDERDHGMGEHRLGEERLVCMSNLLARIRGIYP